MSNNKLYTIPDTAEYAGCSESKVKRDIKAGKLNGQIVAGTYVFSQKAVDAWLLGLSHQVNKLLTVSTASLEYNVGRHRLYALIKDGTLPAHKVRTRGHVGWAFVFYEKDLLAVGKDLAPAPSGPAVKDNVDQRLEYEHTFGMWQILGTKNKFGKPFAYKNKNQARRRAREAFSEPPLYKEGDSVFIKPKGGTMHEVVLLEDVTWIDQSIRVRHNNSRSVLLPIGYLWSKK
jgi:hypothetical protein